MLFDCAIANPTVMIRMSTINNNKFNYDESLRSAEDYALWIKMLPKCTFSNIQEPLLIYRVHGENISVKDNKLQRNEAIKIQEKIHEIWPLSNY